MILHFPSFTATVLYCLVTETHVCDHLAQNGYLTVKWLGVKSVASKMQVQCLCRYVGDKMKLNVHFCVNAVRHHVCVCVVLQDGNKRALAMEQDRAQLEMQIQTFKQNRGLIH